MAGKAKVAGLTIGAALALLILVWMFTAPYLGNRGWRRTPGVILGGTPTPPPADFTPLNDLGGPLIMKLGGFPPFVAYLAYVGTPEGVITATRPDGGYWARRVREGDGDGWLRVGDATYAMRATEVLGDARIPMLEQYSARTGLPMDVPMGGPDPVRDWEVFFWTPR
ncbi:MAG: hypothetical protein FJ207_03255 [Gemmatimonadetes bacterium]|nr:hypothetical protein [Gemmatimonadota bacterium]